jgi:DNA repair protein SbcD/Mre11
MEPFRFVHAARLLLDHPLCGIGPLPDTIRPIVEDATLLAWNQVVEVCLKESVDLLLLTGGDDELCEQGLRGAAALARGFERLSARGISVVIASGAFESEKSFPVGFRWADNVVRLEGSDEVAVRRNGKLLAIVRSERSGSNLPLHETPRLLKLSLEEKPAFRIHVSRSDANLPTDDTNNHSWNEPEAPSIDYDATGGGPIHRTIESGRRLIHDPGPPQGTRPLESGPRGCVLVSVDETGRCERTFVPTAPVRFESIALTIHPEHSRDDLLLEMMAAMERLPRYPSDRVWLVTANVTGTGRYMELLDDEHERNTVLALVHAEYEIKDVQVRIHAFRLHPAVLTDSEAVQHDDLIRQFDGHLTERISQPQWALQRCLDESRLQGGPWANSLRSLLAELDPVEVARGARRLGREWFAAEEEQSP